MECKKCLTINNLLNEKKFEEAHSFIGDNLFSFKHKKVNFFESGHLLACKSCFNLYESKMITKKEDYKFAYLFKKIKLKDEEQLKTLAYSYSLLNLLESVKRSFENKDTVFVYTSSNNDSFNKNSPIFDLKDFGLNNSNNFAHYKFFYSFDDALVRLPISNINALNSSVLLRVELDPKFIEYKIYFPDSPNVLPYPYLSYNKEIKPEQFTVIDYNGVSLSNLSDFSITEYFDNLSNFHFNALKMAILNSKTSYKNEGFKYLDDSELYFNELIEKNK